jgi:tetratricopeptide (TPR) repeat protein
MSATIDSPRLAIESRSNLGMAERGRGRFAQAVSLLEEAAALARERDVRIDLVETLGELSETYRCAGRLADARRVADEVLSLLEGVEREIVHPQKYLWYASKAFAIADPARALRLAYAAHDVMLARAAAIPDAESQANYLELPYNRNIRERLGDVSDSPRTPPLRA